VGQAEDRLVVPEGVVGIEADCSDLSFWEFTIATTLKVSPDERERLLKARDLVGDDRGCVVADSQSREMETASGWKCITRDGIMLYRPSA
jgi:hypothetical protein